jgi:hypothetical protein
VIPRLTGAAGFEFCLGLFIDRALSEAAVEFLRNLSEDNLLPEAGGTNRATKRGFVFEVRRQITED